MAFRPRSRRWLLASLGLLLLPAAACRKADAASGPLPHLGTVPSFALVDQSGKSFGAKDLRGKPHLVSFMFTRCPSVCPQVLAKKKAIAAHLSAHGRELHLVSISIDGENDTPPVLSAYAKKHDLDLRSWTLLTGDAQAVATHAEQSFKIAVSGTPDEAKPHYGLTHGSHLVLVDGSGDIRGYYASMDADTPARLLADLDRFD